MLGHDEAMWFGGGFMWLFWILLIIVVVLAFRFLGTNISDTSTADESPQAILKKPYARGDIDEEEFKRRSKELEK
ncbi:MAG: SHOCT domain-containing protein [Gammaproteobacteria bacterium]|nr:SHOCT domain-containing protein [Gammaproteobacteria bacterium]